MNEWSVESIKRDDVKQRVLVEEKRSGWLRKEDPSFYLLWGGAFFSF
jgi:hypothetical protein